MNNGESIGVGGGGSSSESRWLGELTGREEEEAEAEEGEVKDGERREARSV